MVEVRNPVIEELKKRADELGSQQALADELGISAQHLGDVLKGRRGLGEDVLEQIGFEKVIVHVRTYAVPDVVKAIETAQAEAEHVNTLRKRVFEKSKQVTKS